MIVFHVPLKPSYLNGFITYFAFDVSRVLTMMENSLVKDVFSVHVPPQCVILAVFSGNSVPLSEASSASGTDCPTVDTDLTALPGAGGSLLQPEQESCAVAALQLLLVSHQGSLPLLSQFPETAGCVRVVQLHPAEGHLGRHAWQQVLQAGG